MHHFTIFLLAMTRLIKVTTQTVELQLSLHTTSLLLSNHLQLFASTILALVCLDAQLSIGCKILWSYKILWEQTNTHHLILLFSPMYFDIFRSINLDEITWDVYRFKWDFVWIYFWAKHNNRLEREFYV